MNRTQLAACMVVAMAASGCQLPGSTSTEGRKPVTYKTKQAKVKVMADAFSLSKNTSLKKAAESLAKVAQSLSGAFMPAPPVQALRVAALQEMYRVAGTFEQGDATLTFDDETGELSAIKSKNAEVRFKFDNNDESRTFEAEVVKSPDGTTGTLTITAEGTWKAMPNPPSREFKFMNDEYPETLDKVTFSLKLMPKGDKKLAVELEGTLDDPETFPGATFQAPSRWKVVARIPKIRFDWNSDFDVVAGKSSFKADGEMVVEVGSDQQEQFQFAVDVDEAKGRGTFSLTNVGAKVKLEVMGTQPQPGASPNVTAGLYSTETDEKLGTVEPDPKQPGTVVVTFEDGDTMRWELIPKDFQMPALTPSAQPMPTETLN